jgi:hypothetical protein
LQRPAGERPDLLIEEQRVEQSVVGVACEDQIASHERLAGAGEQILHLVEPGLVDPRAFFVPVAVSAPAVEVLALAQALEVRDVGRQRVVAWLGVAAAAAVEDGQERHACSGIKRCGVRCDQLPQLLWVRGVDPVARSLVEPAPGRCSSSRMR